MRALEILVVDDERDLASGIVEMLEAEGHRVAFPRQPGYSPLGPFLGG